MRDSTKEMIAYILVITNSAFFLFIFILIALYGEFGVHEPNEFILIAEIVLCLGMISLGIERLHSFIKKFRR